MCPGRMGPVLLLFLLGLMAHAAPDFPEGTELVCGCTLDLKQCDAVWRWMGGVKRRYNSQAVYDSWAPHTTPTVLKCDELHNNVPSGPPMDLRPGSSTNRSINGSALAAAARLWRHRWLSSSRGLPGRPLRRLSLNPPPPWLRPRPRPRRRRRRPPGSRGGPEASGGACRMGRR